MEMPRAPVCGSEESDSLAVCSPFCHCRLMMVPLPSKETKPRVSSPPAHPSTHSIVAPCEALHNRYLDVKCTRALLDEL